MQRLIVRHTNDIHGRAEGLARIATLVRRIKTENPDAAVVYFDCGDVEEPTQRLSNVTKGAGMHRLLNLAGCDAAVIGNGAMFVQDEPVDPQREYWVAGTDWEFEPYGGYAPQEWALRPEYDMPFIMRDVIEDYLAHRRPVSVTMGRLENAVT